MNLSQSFPKDLIDLCLMYYYTLFSIFKLYDKKKHKSFKITNDYTNITTLDRYFTLYFFSDYIFKHKSGIHIWSIKCIKRSYAGAHAIAICTKNDPTYLGYPMWSSVIKGSICDRYVWNRETGQLYAMYQNGSDIFKDKTLVKWDNGDIITTILDCNNWTIQYFINMKKVCNKISILPNKYYAGIQLRGKDNNFKVVHIDIKQLKYK